MNDKTFGCVASTIRLRSGLYFDLADPKPDQFTLRDIAGALSKICRFGGHLDRFYSVAEHLCHCADQAVSDQLVSADIEAVFMHDAAEAFVGDMVKPLKIMQPAFSAIELKIELVIAKRFGIDFHGARSVINKIDNEMLIAEKRALFPADSVIWRGQDQVRKLDVAFRLWKPNEAESQFMSRAEKIGLCDEWE
jgi:hypothetical protein